jgi:hypothetical protein
VVKHLFILITGLFLHCFVYADDVKFTLMVSNNQITLQDYLQVQFIIENSKKVTQFIPPSFKNFNVMEGPEQASGWSLQNGVLKEYITFSYLLKPVKAGHILIPSATVKVEGKSYRSNTAWVNVSTSVISGQTEDKSLMSDFIIRKGENIAKKISNNIFVRLDVNKTSCYEGEPLVATYKLYTRLKSESKVTKRPSFNGFSVYDMVDPEREEAGREIYNGREYNVYLLRKVQLYPLQTGKFDLDPVEVENNLTFISEEAMGDDYGLTGILHSLSDDKRVAKGVIRETVTLTNNPVTVDVKPLPEKTTREFSGAVGEFALHTSVRRGVIRKNDVVDVQVEISGKGNFPMLAPPVIQWPDSTEAFESTMKEQFNKFVSPITGSKIFSYPLSVKKEGEITIPAVSLSYFNPATGKYGTARSDSIKIHVDPSRPMVSTLVGQPAEVASGNTWKWALSVIGLLTVFGGLFLILRGNDNPDVKILEKVPDTIEKINTTEAETLVESDPAEKIRNAFEQGDYHQFYRQLEIVIDKWLKKQFNADASGNWQETLRQNGVEAATIDRLEALKRDAAMANYTPFIMDRKMIEDLDTLQKIIG